MFAVIVAICAVGVSLAEPMCRKHWDLGNEGQSCYKVVNIKTSWAQAFMYCTAMRSSLVDISSQEEQDSISGIIRKNYSGYYEQFWTDLSDLSTEGDWRHMTFNNEPQFTTWIAGHLNNYAGSEHCAHINAKPHRGFKWNDHSCQAQLNFICETYPTEE